MNWLAIVPALITILITFRTKRLIPALMAGVFCGAILSRGSLISGCTAIGHYIAEAVANQQSAYTLGFLMTFGALAELIRMAGGISGFSQRVGVWITTERKLLGWSWLLSLVTFFDSSFHVITVSTVMKPLLEKVHGNREKFAFILSVTGIQLMVLIPIATSFLGYMVTLVANNIRGKGLHQSAYEILVHSVVWNYFSWAMLLIAAGVTLLGLGFGRVRLGNATEEAEYTEQHMERALRIGEAVEEYPRRSRNLIVPVVLLVGSTIFFFWWTGKGPGRDFWQSLAYAEHSLAIFTGALLTVGLTIVFYLLQKISLAEIEAHLVTGAEKVVSLLFVLVLSWALTRITQELGFNKLIGQNLLQSIPRSLIPGFIFLMASVVSYMIGSSWATWALVMPLAISFSVSAGIDPAILVGAVWAGGVVIEVVSPLSAKMSGISFGQHLSSAFPYALLGVAGAMAGYIVVGFAILGT